MRERSRARDTSVSALSASKRFGRYKKEAERAVRKPDVKKDKVLRSLIKAFVNFSKYTWEDAVQDSEKSGTRDIDKERYLKAVEAVKHLKYSSRDVEKFSILLADFKEFKDKLNRNGKYSGFGDMAGFFLSALINNGKDREYRIITQHLELDIWWLGVENTKNIRIEGNVMNPGFRMKSGTIIVEGDVKDHVGQLMEGGNITVEGNAHAAGVHMKGGKLHIKGNIETISMMEGGEIHVEGDIGRIDHSINGGKIYLKGKLIVDK